MKRARWVALAVSLLAAVCAASATAVRAAKMLPGQEFLYSGTAEWKQSTKDRPGIAFRGPVQACALIREAEPGRGYGVILMHRFQPGSPSGQASLASQAQVETLRYGADLVPAADSPRTFPSSPIAAIVETLHLPFSPRSELKEGQTWRVAEMDPVLLPRPIEMVYRMTGTAVAGGHPCLKIEKKPAQTLPIKMELGRATVELSDFRHTLCVDPATGHVLSHELHTTQRQTVGDRQYTATYNLSLTLQQVRQLPSEELAARVKQAEAIDRIQRAAFAFTPGVDRKKSVDDATEAAAAFRREYPDSPYAPALTPIESSLSAMRRSSDMQARLDSLKGSPAPAFTLKDLEGKEQTLGAYRGKIILLNFFASW